MTYQSNIPLSGDLISVSQNDVKNNFQAIGTSFPVNHVDFNASGSGKHKFVEMPNQSSDPATVANETTIFAKALSGSSRLYLREENNGSTYQFSGPVSVGTNGSTTVLGGVQIKWGFANTVSDNATISFATAFPTNCYSVVISLSDPNATSKTVNVKAASVGTSSFQVRVSSGSVSFYYVAIGN